MDILRYLAPSFEHYLTLERVHPTRTYNYAARGYTGLPVIEATQHRPKCKIGESWLYVAAPAKARLDALASGDRLYVGAQTQDRMFRGDGMGGSNYHHAEMRAGNGIDNPISFLNAAQKIHIHRISADAIGAIVSKTPAMASLAKLLLQPRTARKHVGYWFEQYILFHEHAQWRWNTATADAEIRRIL
ncbi:MAG: hypothetical protein Q7T25_14520 [Sideroxyarcus sp.]|nr:hypothetical protein [Sideroxyarcus sp.]